MPEVAIPPEESTLLIASEDSTEYWAEIRGGRVQMGRDEATAESADRSRSAPPGDRGKLYTNKAHEELWAYNPSETKVAYVDLDENGFIFERTARAVVGSVLTSDENEAAPASDDYVHRHDTGVDVQASAVSESFEAPNRADFIVINVDDAAGAYSVTVEFEDGDGNVVTKRDADDNADYSGTSSSDVLVRCAVASPHVTVRIEDTSGAANALDYNIYAR